MMRNYFTICYLGLFFILIFSMKVFAAEILLDNYQGGLSSKWVEKSFKGRTHYEVIQENNLRCIKAVSHSAASGLYYEINYEPKNYQLLNWHWKVDHVLLNGNALEKDGDDYAARIYVVFPSILFWKTKAINYIWANKLPRGTAVVNPYSSNTIMIAVESGSSKTGQWIEEERNVFEDFREHFRQDPPRVGAIAIMTDTDNTGEKAVAWYGPIRILSPSSH
jgi:hypothetical protein